MAKTIIDVCCGSRMFHFDKSLWIIEKLKKHCATAEH